MIRPVTLVCWILALGAGLYLYRAKHDVELMDQHIDQIAKQTAELRTESRGLLDEWIRLGEPEQLHRYSDEYLGLQPISPGQFARQGELAARMPPPQPDPPAEQADVAAQSSDGVALPDLQSSGSDAGTAGDDSSEAAIANLVGYDTGGADDIPVPPIPPTTARVTATAASGVTALPLQARPVTPRLADGQTEPETGKSRTGAASPGTDVLRLGTAAVAASVPVDPHQERAGPTSSQAPGKTGGQAHGQPAQGPRDAPGLAPLQAQAPTREVAQGPGRIPAQGIGLGREPGPTPVSRPVESRTADNRLNEPPRETRPVEPQQSRGPAARYGRQGQSIAEDPQSGRSQMAPAQGGSLLGMSRGSMPVPLPAPTPVTANWSGPAGAGSPGSGR